MTGWTPSCQWFGSPEAGDQGQGELDPQRPGRLSDAAGVESWQPIPGGGWLVSTLESLWHVTGQGATTTWTRIDVPLAVTSLALSPTQAIVGTLSGLECLSRPTPTDHWQLEPRSAPPVSPGAAAPGASLRRFGPASKLARVRALARVGDQIFLAPRGRPLLVAPVDEGRCPRESDFREVTWSEKSPEISALVGIGDTLVLFSQEGRIFTAASAPGADGTTTLTPRVRWPDSETRPIPSAGVAALAADPSSDTLWAATSDALCWFKPDPEADVTCLGGDVGAPLDHAASLRLEPAQNRIVIGDRVASVSALECYAQRHRWRAGAALSLIALILGWRDRRARRRPPPGMGAPASGDAPDPANRPGPVHPLSADRVPASDATSDQQEERHG